MAAIFISHSSDDGAQALALKDMLTKIGFDNVFLDFDKHQGIPLGSDWERKLYYELEHCHAVLLVLTKNWLASKWCFAEFAQARALGKTIYVVLENPAGEHEDIAKDIQVCDLVTNREVGLKRLHDELESALLVVQAGFAFDERTRAPYPGLNAFDEQDAAVFFGRDPEISAVLERLKSERGRSKKALVLVGGSGTGKSSLLKAGALPRLRRERDVDGRPIHLVALMRPGDAPLRAILAALRALEPALTLADLAVAANPRAAWALVDRLRMKAGAPQATLVLAIDQAEETFAAPPEEREPFLALMAALIAGDNPARLLLSMRADRIEDAQRIAGLADALELFPVQPMPLDRLGEIVRGPAKRADIVVEEELVEAIRADAATEDALPLVAFVLRELYERYGKKSRRLEKAHYEAMRLDELSPLESAVRQRAEETIAGANEDELESLREAFVPGLVRLDEDRGVFARRDARVVDLPEKSRGLIEKLIGARLLVSRAADDGVRLEAAHEALFRVWPKLAGWLAADRDLLVRFQGVQRAAKEWGANARAEAWLAHRGLRLQEAEVLGRRTDIAARLGLLDRDYLLQCRAREDAAVAAEEVRRREREQEQARRLRDAEELAKANRRIARRTGAGLVAALALAGLAGWQWRLAQTETQRALGAEQKAVAQFQRAEGILTDATGVANSLVSDLAIKMRDRVGMPVKLVVDILGSAHELQRRLADKGEDRPDLLLGQATGLNEIVLTEFRLGDARKALDSAAEFFNIMSGLVGRDPTNREWRRWLSFSRNRRGDALLELGRRQEALDDFAASVLIRQVLVNEKTDDLQAQDDLAAAYEKLGQAQHAVGGQDLDTAADKAFERGQAIREALVAKQPDNRNWRRDLGMSYENRGALAADFGADGEALQDFESCLDVRQKLADDFPDDTELRRDFAIAEDRIGLALKGNGQLDGAQDHVTKSLALRKALASSDAANLEWQRDLAVGLAHEGDIRAARGDPQSALDRYRASLAVRERLAAADPDNPTWQVDLVFDLTRLAQAGDDPRSRLTRALAIARRLESQGALPANDAGLASVVEKRLEAAPQTEQ